MNWIDKYFYNFFILDRILSDSERLPMRSVHWGGWLFDRGKFFYFITISILFPNPASLILRRVSDSISDLSFSILEIYVFEVPLTSANSLCDIPALSRVSRINWPTRIIDSILSGLLYFNKISAPISKGTRILWPVLELRYCATLFHDKEDPSSLTFENSSLFNSVNMYFNPIKTVNRWHLRYIYKKGSNKIHTCNVFMFLFSYLDSPTKLSTQGRSRLDRY